MCAKVQFTERRSEPRMLLGLLAGWVHRYTLEPSYFQCLGAHNSGKFLVMTHDVAKPHLEPHTFITASALGRHRPFSAPGFNPVDPNRTAVGVGMESGTLTPKSGQH